MTFALTVLARLVHYRQIAPWIFGGFFGCAFARLVKKYNDWKATVAHVLLKAHSLCQKNALWARHRRTEPLIPACQIIFLPVFWLF